MDFLAKRPPLAVLFFFIAVLPLVSGIRLGEPPSQSPLAAGHKDGSLPTEAPASLLQDSIFKRRQKPRASQLSPPELPWVKWAEDSDSGSDEGSAFGLPSGRESTETQPQTGQTSEEGGAAPTFRARRVAKRVSIPRLGSRAASVIRRGQAMTPQGGAIAGRRRQTPLNQRRYGGGLALEGPSGEEGQTYETAAQAEEKPTPSAKLAPRSGMRGELQGTQERRELEEPGSSGESWFPGMREALEGIEARQRRTSGTEAMPPRSPVRGAPPRSQRRAGISRGDWNRRTLRAKMSPRRSNLPSQGRQRRRSETRADILEERPEQKAEGGPSAPEGPELGIEGQWNEEESSDDEGPPEWTPPPPEEYRRLKEMGLWFGRPGAGPEDSAGSSP